MLEFDDSWSGMGGIGRFADSIKHQLPNVRLKKFSNSPASPFSVLKNSKIKKDGNDLVLFPGYIPPLFSRADFIFTIHDLNHLDRSDNSNRLKRIFYNVFIRRGCCKAKYIFTVSEFSKEKIIDWAGVNPDKVINVGNGVDEKYNENVIPFNPGYPYFLSVSNRKPHKNEKRIIEAFFNADLNFEIKLVFTGKSTTELVDFINRKGNLSRVVFTGYIDESMLPSLYKGALALVFPSLYEGFGLPVIEAMACGTPVITSTTTSLPEVAGDAALLVDPMSVAEISNSILRIVNEPELRNNLIARGYSRTKVFTWDNVLLKIKSVLNMNG